MGLDKTYQEQVNMGCDYKEITNTAAWDAQHLMSAVCFWSPATPTHLYAAQSPFCMARAELNGYNRSQLPKTLKFFIFSLVEKVCWSMLHK